MFSDIPRPISLAGAGMGGKLNITCLLLTLCLPPHSNFEDAFGFAVALYYRSRQRYNSLGCESICILYVRKSMHVILCEMYI